MLDDIIVIGVVMALVQIIKAFVLGKFDWADSKYSAVSALMVLVLAGLLQVANAAVFDQTVPMIVALGMGLRLGATAGGIYAIGKAALGVVTTA